jgi:hypothetical protein
LIVMSEKHPDVYPWLLGAYSVSQESPFTFSAISDFTCKPNRGGTDKSFFIVNHWLRPDGPPDPVAAAKVNSQKVLTERLQDCIATRQQIPNAVAVDFTAIGDLQKTVRRFNGAIARQSGVTATVDETVRQLQASDQLTDAEVNELRRLPKLSEAEARQLLGPLADSIPTPRGLPRLASPCPPGTHAATDAELKADKQRAKAAATSTSTTAPSTAAGAATAPTAPTTTTTPPPGTVVQNGCAND